MPHEELSRRNLLRSGMLGTCGAMAGISSLLAADGVRSEQSSKPGSLTITNVETFLLQYKLPRQYGVSIALNEFRKSLLVKISTDSGLVGWGETIDLGGTQAIIERNLKKTLLGQNPLDHRRLWRTMWSYNFGDGRAMAAVDIALHDLRGKALGLSVADQYGGRLRDSVLAYAAAMHYTDGVDPEDQFPTEAAGLAKRGFRAMKIRTGRLEPRRDLAVLAKIREAVGGDIRLLTDGNGAFTLPQAVQFGKELEKLDFYCFEEPLPQGLNYAGYDELTRTLDIAVAGGEVLDSRTAARDHIVKRSFDIIQPDVILCGGVAETLFIAEMARLFSIQCVPHCWAGAISIAATLQVLALLPPYTHGFTSDEPMLEFDTTENPFREQLITKPFAIDASGRVAIPTAPGLGIEVNEDTVQKYLVRA
jgi:D-galactarolactone cycloisomerase